MTLLTTAGFYCLSSLASISEEALVRNNISGQLAAANGNLTALKTEIAHGLAAGPAYRGTLDIAWSCLLTILACIYNAIHLNVPPRNTGKWMLLRKVKWAIIALIAPEIVLYTAATQLREAYKVKKEVNAMRGQTRGKNKPKLIDLRYGFYVIMGGFVYDVKNLRDDLSVVTLTPSGIIALARQGQFVDINTEDITDKSKAGIFTKSFVCVQVSWMVIQCIARKTMGYPLALLEIHTMVHVVCALTIYVLWWKKPYDIVEPTVIYAANYANYAAIVALMIMGSKINRRQDREAKDLYFDLQASLDNNVKNLAVSGQETSVADTDGRPTQVLGEADSFGVIDHHKAHFKLDQEDISPEPTVCTLRPSQYLPCGIGVRAHTLARYDLSSSDVQRWELGASAIVEILNSSPREEYNLAEMVKIDSLVKFLREYGFCDAFKEHMPNFPEEMLSTMDGLFHGHESVLKDTRSLFLYLLRFFTPLTAAYGGIHLSAWNFEFASRVESFIWKVACFIIILSSLALLAVRSWLASLEDVENYFKPLIDTRLHQFLRAWKINKVFELLTYLAILVSGLYVFCYGTARLYLVVESFISLRHVPIGVYAAIPWVQNIPHV